MSQIMKKRKEQILRKLEQVMLAIMQQSSAITEKHMQNWKLVPE